MSDKIPAIISFDGSRMEIMFAPNSSGSKKAVADILAGFKELPDLVIEAVGSDRIVFFIPE